MDVDDAIAVVGVAAHVPGASHVDAFWVNLLQGRESVTALSEDELRAYGVSEEELAHPAYVRAAALAPDVETFDASLFGMTPREAQTCDPQIRLFLHTAHAAIENAGYDPTTVGAGTGVFASAGAPLYYEHHLRPRGNEITSPLPGAVTLNHGGYIATMASYKLDLHGPSVTVQTACSSTLVALHLACQSLRVGDCDTALVGGASIDFPLGHGYRWLEGGVQSRSGHCRPFDADADGTVFGDGACSVLLKRLPDALADHDHIRAVIRGSAVNNDGADKVSFGAPSVAAQRAVVMEALAVAEVEPGDISYVEAHGTATTMGDPIEIRALNGAFIGLAGEPLPAGSCAIGSVKGNIGHLGPVAGLAGFIKTVLALEHEQLPPSINYQAASPRLGLPLTPFRVQDRLTAWPRDPARPRRAAVSSMGIGGSNAHVVLEEPPVQPLMGHRGEPRVVVWSSPTLDAEPGLRADLAEAFMLRGEQAYADSVATLQQGRQPHPVRAAAVCTGAHDAATTLTSASGERIAMSHQPLPRPRTVCLLFPGQGSQHVAMARGLHGSVPTFTDAFEEWLERLDSPDLPLRACWEGTAGLDITETSMAQPLLFATELALARMWHRTGVRPAAVLGHSLGELAAATVAGVFEPDDAAALVLARARAMRDPAAGGAMLAVTTAEGALGDLLTGTVTVAVVNRADQIVLSGSENDLDDVAAELADRGVACTRLPTSGAFHTPLLHDAARAFEKAFSEVSPAPPKLPLYSAATGRLVGEAQAVEPSFWAEQLIRPVRFATALDALLQTEPGLLLEVGPGQVLTDLARRHDRVRRDSVDVVPTLARRSTSPDGHPRTGDLATMLEAAARLWAAGIDVSWETVGQAPLRHRIPLPGYPYQRSRHWVDAPTARGPEPTSPATNPTARRTAAGSAVSDGPVGSGPVSDRPPASEATTPFSSIRWTSTSATPPNLTRTGTTAVVFLPEDTDRAADVLGALEGAGIRTVRVRPAASYRHDGEEFGIRPGAAADLDRVLAELEGRGVDADLLVHATASATWAPPTTENAQDQLDRSFFGMLTLIQRGLRTGPSGRVPELIALTTGAVDVSGADPVDPLKASIPGLVRTLAAELPAARCKVVDFSARTPAQDLREELCRADRELLVALRGRNRWVPQETPLEISPQHSSLLRSGGAYVITGGMGGLGLATMRRLAGTGARPRIALLGRTVPTDRTPHDAWGAEVAAAVAEATELGAEVRLLSCDVADPRQVRRVLDVVTAEFGPVRGLLHLAGVAGDGILQLRHPARAADVLRPKVSGTLALAEALAGRPSLDWLVLFSSRAAVDGLLGSGDYAAANAVMDLCARVDRLPADRVLSIGYPSWTTVGMASRPGGAPRSAELLWTTRLSAEDTWALDEHRLDGTPILPGTGFLDLVLRAYDETLPADGTHPTGADDGTRGAALGAAVVLGEVAFAVPLVAREPRAVRVAFVPDGERHRFEIASRPADDTLAPWTTHVTGRIERQHLPAPVADGVALRGGSRRTVEAATGAFSFGPRWDSVRMIRDGEQDRLLDLRLPHRFAGDLHAHPLHPALLDLATSAVRGSPGPGPGDDPEQPYLPFLYRKVTVFAPLQAQIRSHVRRRPSRPGSLVADVDVLGSDDRVLVAIEGFTMRRVDGDAVLGAGAAALTDPGQRPGLDPETGTDLLLTLLASRTPQHVLVRPHRGGRPEPVRPVRPVRPEPVRPADARPADARPADGPRPDPGSVLEAPAGDPPAAHLAPDETALGEIAVAERLRALWARTLGTDRIELDDDFFDLGGNSLSAIELMAQIREHFDLELTVGFLFEAPTLAELTEVIKQRMRS